MPNGLGRAEKKDFRLSWLERILLSLPNFQIKLEIERDPL